MIASLVMALGAATCFGLASVLQQVGARRAAASTPLGLSLLVAFVRQGPFAQGLALDVIGFVLNLWALQRLPLFVVQPAVASAVAVTAVLASRYLGERLRRSERWAVGGIVAGLALVAVSASSAAAPSLQSTEKGLLLAGVPLIALAAAAVHRNWAGPGSAAALGALAGLAFAGFGIAGRVLPPPTALASLVVDPVTWTVALYATLGLVLYGAALQRGSVTPVTAISMMIEVLVPAGAGLLLSDHARPGLAAVATAGFIISFVGALVLACPRPSRPGHGGTGAERAGSLRQGSPSLGRPSSVPGS
jgi:drug/metabolite transporter (DMT)-like permease